MPNITPRLGLSKPLGTEVVDISVINNNADLIDAGVAKKSDFDAHTADSVKHITAAERTAWNAKQDASANLSASQVTQDSTHRFATDTEKATWNGKQDALGFTPVNSTDVVTTAAANKILKLDVNSKLPASITGDAATVNGVQVRLNGTQFEYWDGTGWASMSAIKSVQRGTASIVLSAGVNSGSVAITLSSVNTNKTAVNITGVTDNNADSVFARGTLTNSTTLTINAQSNVSNRTLSVDWEVIEYV